jgi:hypothetical protein
VAAMAICAHELGHVQQYQTGSALIGMRSFLLPALQFSPTVSYIAIIAGLYFNMTGLFWIGIAFFALMVLFSILTLPVEFDASRRGLKLLREAVEIAETLKIPSTFVETNCYWCKTDELTFERLQTLKEKGLKGIMISVNPFYTEYVPFERTDRCIRISQAVFGPNVMIYQLEYYHLFKQLGVTGRLSIDEYLNLTREESVSDRVELFLMGRAAEKLKGLYPGDAAKRFFSTPCLPDFLRSWHNHFDNYGNFMPGYCGGISLGSWFKLDQLLQDGIDLQNRPVLKFLVNQDMQGLFNFAAERGYHELSDGYVSKCHLCLDIRKFLAPTGDYPELSPIQFYEQLK